MISPWVIHDNALSALSRLHKKSVRTCITSPPYWLLRDYGDDTVTQWPSRAQSALGAEHSPQDYVENLVCVMRAVRDVLADDGTLWVNIGDKYAAKRFKPWGLKPGELCGLPWRFAFAMLSDGWYLRRDIIWHKPNAKTESVKNRPSGDHEYVFLFTTRRTGYYYDADAIREPYTSSYSQDAIAKAGGVVGGPRPKGDNFSKEARQLTGERTPSTRAARAALLHPLGRNKRSVWRVNADSGNRHSHLAPFPAALVEPCVAAGSEVGDWVLDPFGGSGSTGLAAMRSGRKFVGIDPSAIAVSIMKDRLRGIGQGL